MDTSWENSHDWYDKIVGERGHYYHQSVIFPQLLKLLNLQKGDSLVDLACGPGALANHLPPDTGYLGIDAAPSFIQVAKTHSPHAFLLHDLTQPLPKQKKTFTHATLILALQNIVSPLSVLQNASRLLTPGGKFAIVLNHPCFRIPRQSSWQVDESKKLQYRRVDMYLSDLKIPITTNPGKGKKGGFKETWSFHHPLSSYTQWLNESGFTIDLIAEWASDKKSTGAAARMENRSRAEFPLFLTLLCSKKRPN